MTPKQIKPTTGSKPLSLAGSDIAATVEHGVFATIGAALASIGPVIVGDAKQAFYAGLTAALGALAATVIKFLKVYTTDTRS